MDSKKVALFMRLAGQELPDTLEANCPKKRCLGAQLLLSEVLEYIIHGLKVTPSFEGTPITDPNGLHYEASDGAEGVDKLHMVDGLADTVYTTFWNSEAFGVPLHEAFELVAANNLTKFVRLDGWENGSGVIEESEWHLGREVQWPEEVVRVEAQNVDGEFYAVGKDKSGKVRKPSLYRSVELEHLVPKD